MSTKRTDELVKGDRVSLPGGIVRTVECVTDSGYVNAHDVPILSVWYREAPNDEWHAGGNSANAATLWTLA